MSSTQSSAVDTRRSSASSASFATSRASSPKPNPEENANTFVSEAPIYPLPAYARDHPKPTDEVNIDELLSRKPGRWTFRGTVAASLSRPDRPFANESTLEKARAEECAAAKKSLLESAASMKPTGGK